MKNSLATSPLRHAARAGVFVSTFIAVIVAMLSAAEKPAVVESPVLEQQLLGTWVLVGEPGRTGEPPPRGGTLAFRTGGLWTEVEVDPRSGLVRKTSGGTYRLRGNAYEETVDYGTENVADWVGQTYRWTVTIEGDTLTRIGQGNPWTHVWKRVK